MGGGGVSSAFRLSSRGCEGPILTRTRPKGRDRTRQPLSGATRPADCELVKPGLNRFQAIRAAHWIRTPPLLCAHRHGYFAHVLPLLNWLHGSIRAANHGSSSGVSADQPCNAKQPFEGRRRSAGSSLGNPFRPQVKVFLFLGGAGVISSETLFGRLSVHLSADADQR